MKDYLSLIYQFLIKKGIRYPYIYTILIGIFFIMIHLFLSIEIIKILGFKFEINNNYILIISIMIASVILVFYKKNSLLELQFSEKELKAKITPVLYYSGILLISLLIIQYI